MSVSFKVDTKKAEKDLEDVPHKLAKAVNRGSLRGLNRYRGHHRKRRMSRKSDSETKGIYARGNTKSSGGKGVRQNKWFPINELGETLDTAGAEIRVSHLILGQLDRGKTIRARGRSRMIVPFSKHTKKGRVRPRVKRLLKQQKLTLIETKHGKAILVEKKGRKKNKWVVHYHLQSRIVIPPRLEFEDLFETKEAEDVVMNEIQHQFDREVEAINRER